MKDPFSLADRNIIITGASSGIGRQCSIDISNRGANVILIGRNIEELEYTKTLCNKNIKCSVFAFDLSDLSEISELIKGIVDKRGAIDGFLHAAGIQKTLPYGNFKMEDYESIYKVNFLSAMEIIKHISKKKNRKENSKYVLISSITGVIGRPGVVAYSASKGAIISAVRTLSIELASKGININCISPGTILTPLMQDMMDSLTEEQRQKRKDGFLLGLGEPSDIANSAIFLLSDASRWITGQNLIVDGGYTVQ